jgi:hypothetical protein
LLDQWNPSVLRYPNDATNPLFNEERWTIHSYCNPLLRDIDLVNAGGTPGKVAEFLERDCTPDQFTFAAAVYNTEIGDVTGGQVVYLPYDLGYVIQYDHCYGKTKDFHQPARRGHVLRDIITQFGYTTGAHICDTPATKPFQVDANYPNPFNPSTRIGYFMPQAGKLTIAIYNVRGELVKQLIDEAVPEGAGNIVWHGTDDSGAEVASGVYFYKTVALGKTSIQKMALVR